MSPAPPPPFSSPPVPLAWRGADPAVRPLGWAPPARPRLGFGDRWLFVFGLALMGYALLGRGFAYLGVPPLFVGEVLLATGLVALAQTRRFFSVLPLGPMPLVAAFLCLVVVRTLPYLGTYGLDAARDAMIGGYALYAFIVAGLLMARPARLVALLTRYRTLLVVLLALAWALYYVYRQNLELMPILPWSVNTHVFENKPGDLLVHMAGITAFLVFGLRRSSPMLLALLLFSVGVLMVGNRGGMMGYLLAVGVAILLKPPSARFGRLGYVGLGLVAVLLLVDTTDLRTNEGSRSVSVVQIWENVKSVFGKSDSFALNTTTEWRTTWWKKIAGYTLGGPYFWDGRGFGINLAEADGYSVDEEETLRSPHNIHMTVLARAGVPGLVLWVALLATWFAHVLGAWRRARHAGQERWMAVFAMAVVYAVAALVNASFDVYLEGPMGAIWFWTVYGAAVAAVWIHRRQPELLDALATRPAGPPPAASVPWAWTPVRRPSVAPQPQPA